MHCKRQLALDAESLRVKGNQFGALKFEGDVKYEKETKLSTLYQC